MESWHPAVFNYMNWSLIIMINVVVLIRMIVGDSDSDSYFPDDDDVFRMIIMMRITVGE